MKAIRVILSMIASALLLSLTLSAAAQWEKKPPAEWSEKDAKKILNDSGWGRTQAFSSPVTLFRGPQTGSQGITNGQSANTANATHVNFRVRFFSAKPIRAAHSRQYELKQKGRVSEELAAQLKNLVSAEFPEYIIVTVSCDADEPGANVQQAMSLLHSRGTADLKNNTFLETKGGQRIFLEEFQTPKPDGFGARFIFKRNVDGKPFITPESEEIRFYAELDPGYRLDRRFKTKDMMYDGKLEY